MEGRFCTKCGAPAGTPAPPAAPTTAAPAAAAQAGPAQIMRKKTNPWVWVIVGVVGFFVFIGVALVGTGLFVAHKVASDPGGTVARLLTAGNPNLEVLSSGGGVIKVRDRKTGQVLTADFEDIKRGNFTLRDEQGNTVSLKATGSGDNGTMEVRSKDGTVKWGAGTAANIPGWVPTYPGAKAEGVISSQSEGGAGGMFAFTTGDSAKAVMDFYEQALKDKGYKINARLTTDTGGTLTGEDGDKRTVTVTTETSSGQTKGNVMYSTKP